MGVPVTRHTIVDVANAFLQMLADQVGFLMFVAIETREFAEVIGRRMA